MFEVQLEVKIYQFGLLFVHENTIYNTNRFFLQECGRSWRVSDCEELLGVTAFGTFIAVFEISFHNYGNEIPV